MAQWTSDCLRFAKQMPIIEKAKVPPTRTVSFRVPVDLATELDEVRAALSKAGAQLDLTDPVIRLLRREVKEARAYLVGRGG